MTVLSEPKSLSQVSPLNQPPLLQRIQRAMQQNLSRWAIAIERRRAKRKMKETVISMDRQSLRSSKLRMLMKVTSLILSEKAPFLNLRVKDSLLELRGLIKIYQVPQSLQ